MRHVDLFSGIGGFAYAAQQVWGKEYQNVLFCDNNKFCQAVIRKNFGKDSVIYEDIRKVTTNTHLHRLQEPRPELTAGGDRQLLETATNPRGPEPLRISNSAGKEISEAGHCDLLTGGFPCQPFSMAGARKGTGDDRYLWPEMLRVIKEFKPTYIIGENVAGILSMAQYESEARVASETDLFGNKTDKHTRHGRGILYGIIKDIEQVGYAVQVFVIPACAVGAPHRRDRVWIVAHSGHRNGQGTQNQGEPNRQISSQEDAPESKRPDSDARKGSAENTAGDGRRKPAPATIQEGSAQRPQQDRQLQGRPEGPHRTSADTQRNGHKERHPEARGAERPGKQGRVLESAGEDSALSHAQEERLQRSQQADRGQGQESDDQLLHGRNREWDRNWLEVATELCGVDDGIRAGLDGSVYSGEGLKLTRAGHRVERLKALGNAIVPQIAVEIMRAIKSVEESK